MDEIGVELKGLTVKTLIEVLSRPEVNPNAEVCTENGYVISVSIPLNSESLPITLLIENEGEFKL